MSKLLTSLLAGLFAVSAFAADAPKPAAAPETKPAVVAAPEAKAAVAAPQAAAQPAAPAAKKAVKKHKKAAATPEAK